MISSILRRYDDIAWLYQFIFLYIIYNFIGKSLSWSQKFVRHSTIYLWIIIVYTINLSNKYISTIPSFTYIYALIDYRLGCRLG